MRKRMRLLQASLDKEGKNIMAKFISRCANQVLCMRPKRVQIIDGIAQTVEGQHIRFENGEVQTEDKQEIMFIRKHRLFGSGIFEEKASGQMAQ